MWMRVTPQLGGLPPAMGQAQWVATRHTGLDMCSGTTHAGAGAGVGAVRRTTPAITQLFHLVGGDPPSGGLVLPTGWAQ